MLTSTQRGTLGSRLKRPTFKGLEFDFLIACILWLAYQKRMSFTLIRGDCASS